MSLDIPLPTAAPEDDPPQYIPLLLSAIEGFLLARDVWSEADYADARQYMNQLMLYVTEVFEMPLYQPTIGEYKLSATESVPSMWLLCDGSAVSRTTYAELFGFIGTNYGAGNGTTTFNIPDFRDKSPMGAFGSVVAAPGNTAGALEVTLVTGNLPAHNHGVTDPGHTHAPLSPSTTFLGNKPSSSNVAPAGSGIGTAATTASATTGITTNNTGSGTPHSNLHPVLGVNVMIYTGVP